MSQSCGAGGGPRVSVPLFAWKTSVGNHCGKEGKQLPKPQDSVKDHRGGQQRGSEEPVQCACCVMRQTTTRKTGSEHGGRFDWS